MNSVRSREHDQRAPRPQSPARDVQLSAEHITKRYGHFTALEDISIDIREGEFLTLLGPSGSGKSTFLNILAGFEQPSSGRLVQKGADLTHVPPENRNFGMVFQGYALFPHLTVEQNVCFPLRVRGVGSEEQRKRTREILDSVGLSAHAGKHPQQLSGGQQQRVALARALVFSPHMLLLDEPFSALDKNLREQLQFEVKRIHREFGKTFVFVTHDQSEALSMSTRVAIFDSGRLRQIGTPDEVYTRPASEFVASFLGHINLFPVRNGRVEGGQVVAGFGSAQLRAAGNVADARQFAVRPENATLYSSEPEAHLNRVPVVVRNTAYHGATVFLEMTSAEEGGVPLSLVMPTEEWHRRFAGLDHPLWLGWPPEKTLILNAD